MTRTNEGFIREVRQGPPVEVRPGIRTFQWLEYTVDPPGGEYRLGIRQVYRPGAGYALVRLTVDMIGPDTSISSETLRRLPIGRYTALATNWCGREEIDADAVLRIVDTTWTNLAEALVEATEPGAGAALRRRGRQDREALEAVAATYEAAQAEGRPPAQAVATMLECSPATAGSWIAAAKDAGVLTVAPAGRRRG